MSHPVTENAIRIVPLLEPQKERRKIVHPPPPTGLTYRNGPLITSVQIKTIFWGAAWQGPQAALLTQINQFFQFIVTSSYIDQLSEYNVAGFAIGHGALAGSQTITIPAPAVATSDADIQNLISTHASLLSPRHPPPPPPVNNTLYFVFLPPGIQVSMGGGTSCGAVNGFCGYHGVIAGTTLYAVVPYPGCSGCGSTIYKPIDAITMFSSHELAEAITDPLPGHGWYNDTLGEIGDFCNQQPKQLGGYNVQKLWSNRQNACV